MDYKELEKNIKIIDQNIIPSNDVLNLLKTYITSENRFNHSLRVAKLCYEVAISNKLDNPIKYYLVGLLHDIGKNIDEEKSLEIMEKYFREYLSEPSYAYHAFVGACIAENDFHIKDRDFIESIMWHCTGKSNMSLLSKVLYACDKIEPGRKFDSSTLIAAMMNNCETGFSAVVSANYEFLKSKFEAKGLDFDKENSKYSKELFNQYIIDQK